MQLSQTKVVSTKTQLTLTEPVYGIFVLRFWPKQQQFSVALPTPQLLLRLC